MPHRSARRTFTVDALETRRLLTYFAYVQVNSSLETTSGSNAITVAPNQAVTFSVSVTGSALGGAGGPTPTGTVNIDETYSYQGVLVSLETESTQVTLVAAADNVNGYGLATATGTLALVNPNGNGSSYQAFVYADYQGDNNYAETTSAGSPPSNDGNVGNTVTVNFTAAVNKLAFIQNPSDAAAGDTIQPPVTVAVEDSSGNIQTAATDPITVSLASTSTGTGTLAGTTTEAAVGGTATFSNLSINTGGNYTLTATDATAASAATSSSFDITAGKLVFLPPPLATTQTAGEPLQPTIKVELEDGSGNAITDEDGTLVTLSLIGATDANPITGNTAALSGGIATFSDVVLTKPGTYQLRASDPDGDAMGASNKFGIGGDKLSFAVQPKDGDPGQLLSVKVKALTPKGELDTTLDDTLQLGLDIVSGGAGAMLAGTTTIAFQSGVATFTTKSGLAVSAPGTYTLSATALSEGSADLTVAAATSSNFTIANYHMVITGLPGSVDVFDAVPLKVTLTGADGKVDELENSAQVQLALDTVSGGDGAVIQGTTLATFKAGVATFTAAAGPTVNGGGTFTLTATEIGADSPAAAAVSKPLVILPYVLRQVEYPGAIKEFLAERGMQILSAGGGSDEYYAGVYTAQGKLVIETQTVASELPDLHYTVIPVSPGAAVDHSFDANGFSANVVPLTHSSSSSSPAQYTTYGDFLEFETPGSYRLQFDPVVATLAGVPNLNAAPSAIKPFTTPLLKAVDPVIAAATSARVIGVGDTFTVTAHLWFPDGGNPAANFLFTNTYVGIRFQLLGEGSVEAYTQPLPFQQNASLDLAIPKPGKYQLVLSVVYTPGYVTQPFSSSDFVAADGLASVTIPIVVTN